MSPLVIPDHVAGLIFDFDGTLVDSIPLHDQAWTEVYNARGVALNVADLVQFTGMPTFEIVKQLNLLLELELDPATITREKDEAAFRLMDQVQPITVVSELAMSKANHFPIGIASGNTEKNIRLALQSLGWNTLFKAVVTADSGVKPKPNPDLFQECARQLGVAPELCHVLEDGEVGFAAARAAGMSYTDVRPFANYR